LANREAGPGAGSAPNTAALGDDSGQFLEISDPALDSASGEQLPASAA
jgi:hypothetical protein